MKNVKNKYLNFIVGALVFLLMVIDYIIIFYPFENNNKYTYSVDQTNIALESDIYDVEEISEELGRYTTDYCKENMKPVYGSYKLTDDNSTAMIAFINKKNSRATSLEFNIDINKKCVTSVKYIKGYKLKAPDYFSDSFEYDGINIYDEYQQCMTENSDCSKAYFFLSDSNIDVIPVTD